MAEGDDGEPAEAVINIEPAQQAGVWANWARVSHSPYEFTLDFVRLDFASRPPQGIVVARVSVSPLLISQLIEALNDNWSTFVERSMPPEVTHGKQVEGGEGDDPTPAA